MRFDCLSIVRSEQGNSLVEVALLVPVMIAILTGAVDFGRAYYLANEVAGAAQAGAVYGSQNITDTAGMASAAKLDAPDVSSISASGSWGCECSDGSSASASCTTTPTSCSANVVYYAKVTASASYKPVVPWPGIPSSILIARSVTMRSASE